MPIDPEYLREQYASLSDEALLEIHRVDLVQDAQRIYDEEVARRRPADGDIADEPSSPEAARVETKFALDDAEPDWLADAAKYSPRWSFPDVCPRLRR